MKVKTIHPWPKYSLQILHVENFFYLLLLVDIQNKLCPKENKNRE